MFEDCDKFIFNENVLGKSWEIYKDCYILHNIVFHKPTCIQRNGLSNYKCFNENDIEISPSNIDKMSPNEKFRLSLEFNDSYSIETIIILNYRNYKDKTKHLIYDFHDVDRISFDFSFKEKSFYINFSKPDLMSIPKLRCGDYPSDCVFSIGKYWGTCSKQFLNFVKFMTYRYNFNGYDHKLIRFYNRPETLINGNLSFKSNALGLVKRQFINPEKFLKDHIEYILYKQTYENEAILYSHLYTVLLLILFHEVDVDFFKKIPYNCKNWDIPNYLKTFINIDIKENVHSETK